MVKNVITLQKDASALDAAKLMNESEIGCLVIFDKDKIVGILTERDLLQRVLAESNNPKKIRVSKIMTRQVIVGKPDMDLVEAVRLMAKNKVKKLPITEGHLLTGMVTLTDIAYAAIGDKKTLELIDALSNMHETMLNE